MFVVKRTVTTTTTTTTSTLISGLTGAATAKRFISQSQPLSAPASSSVYDELRRKRDRKGLVNLAKEEDEETAMFPNQRQGVDYALNWTLNSYSVTPSSFAYRNPSVKLLVQHSDVKKESTGAYSYQAGAEVKPINYYLDEQSATLNASEGAAGSTITVAQYKALLNEVKNHIGDSTNIYVHDGAVGSHQACEGKIRAITNCAQTALFLEHLLPSTVPTAVKEFKHSMTLYVAPQLQLSAEQQAKCGLRSGAFNIIDVKRGIAVIGGVQSTDNIRRALTAISQPTMLNERQGVTLSAADIYQTRDNKTMLIFSADNYLLNKRFESGKVVAQGSLWNKDGLFRLFDSISYPLESAAKNQFDLIERFTSPKRVVSIVPVEQSTNIYSNPSSIVFLVRDTKGIIPAFAELSPEQAQQYFAAGYNGDSFTPYYSSESITVSPKSKAELFKKLVQDNSINVYIVNTLSFQKEADVDKLLSVISSGKVNKSSKSDIYKTLSPIKLSETKVSEVDKNKVKEFESNFETFVAKLLQ
ncbi:hypothetical protein SAMD00019534_074250 [Acytostelium subglobosum LB1]|uniref:hypothetical protein n=1 Tax=Acytostelium subglobosum LB1 TaxID=1410327 RepID=UPI000644B368|nr:hypothetical protein SAMD00019534_074250 [Acytostelium subglobosum LB1]GAM24250.1 hypothetical protein SAMD00019534_074250 [Acytostelium subglobosum LB1]|eukprot:XP_012752576.1 hypothetical protein SAMD00019534_074250 [Acytostelium subglobosum LB1]